MPDNIKITKLPHQIRTLNAKWSLDIETMWHANDTKPVSKMTEAEKEDEVIRRLREPPKPKQTYEDDLTVMWSMAIAKQIDKEIIETLRKQQ